MATREITQEEYWQGRLTPDKSEPDQKPASRYKIRLPVITTDGIQVKAAKTIAGIALALIGASQTGSYTGLVMARLTGPFATLFYTWQLGTFMICAGCILIYDTWKR